MGRFPVQTPLGARPGLGTQLRYEAPGDLRVEYVKRRQRLTAGERGCPLDNGPKLAVGQPNSSLKKIAGYRNSEKAYSLTDITSSYKK